MNLKFIAVLTISAGFTLAAWAARAETGSAYDFNLKAPRGDAEKSATDFASSEALFGFAETSNSLQLREAKKVKKGWLGISMKDPRELPSDPQSGDTIQAIEISAIAADSGADIAGLRAGDLIVAIDGAPLRSGDEAPQAYFRKRISDRQLGDVVALRIFRGNNATEVPVTLKSYPKIKSVLKQHPEFASRHGENGKSVLQQVLEKEALTDEFAKLLDAIRNEADKAVSPQLRGETYNPFRLEEVNYVMYRPMELPLVARKLTNRLSQSFNGDNHDLAALVHISMDELDMAQTDSNNPNPTPPTGITGYVERLVMAIQRANSERTAVLSVLDVNEIDFLYATAPKLLDSNTERIEGVDAEIAKRKNEATLLRFFKLVMKLDLQRLMNASTEIAHAIDPDALKGLDMKSNRLTNHPGDWKVREEAGVTVVETNAGRVLIGGTGNNVYSEDAALIIDLGGNDKYYNHAAGSTRAVPFSVVIDLSGDDIYSSAEDFSQGGGLLGGGFLVDIQGDDQYTAKNYSQGAGVLGVGMLADLQGNDQYHAIAESQGAGIFGAGVLAEGGGDDNYAGKFFVQGAGYIKGMGAIVEAGGNDNYFAGGLYPDFREPGKAYLADSQGFGYGMRPDNSFLGTSGGIG
ncbi:MAG: PDZ domain-containing protein, partial [Gallionella sp.]